MLVSKNRSNSPIAATEVVDTQSSAPIKPSGTVFPDTQSVAPSEATTLVPGNPRAANNVQPTGFDVSPEGVRRAAANAGPREPVDTSYMSEEDKAKLRAKGINPELKAEMDAKVYGKKKGKGSGWRGLWRIFSLGNSW